MLSSRKSWKVQSRKFRQGRSRIFYLRLRNPAWKPLVMFIVNYKVSKCKINLFAERNRCWFQNDSIYWNTYSHFCIKYARNSADFGFRFSAKCLLTGGKLPTRLCKEVLFTSWHSKGRLEYVSASFTETISRIFTSKVLFMHSLTSNYICNICWTWVCKTLAKLR